MATVLLPTSDRGTASRAAYLLAALSEACHYHPYELAPTATELVSWLDKTAQLVTQMAVASRASGTADARASTGTAGLATAPGSWTSSRPIPATRS